MLSKSSESYMYLSWDLNMADQSALQPDYQLLFLRPADPSESIKLAFKSMDDRHFEPNWISEEDCFNISCKDASKIFVCDSFSGEVFCHLEKVHCRIVGPQCILKCLSTNKPIPRVPIPLYSIVMKDVIVTCTNMDRKQKDYVERKVLLMGGIMSKVLVPSVTHLITIDFLKEQINTSLTSMDINPLKMHAVASHSRVAHYDIGSKKYFVAGSLNLPLMLPSWIDECWDLCKEGEFDCNEASLLDKHRCPIFRGCRITVSQLSAADRLTMSPLIKKHGGMYSGTLNIQETTHLVLTEPYGKKYICAKKGKVHCVNPQWIYDSINREYCLDWSLYNVNDSTTRASASTSTPERKSNLPPISCEISKLNCSKIEPSTSSSHIDETVMTEFEMTFLKRGHKQNSNKIESKHVDGVSKVLEELDRLDLQEVKKFGLFLDGCRIFIHHGFSGTRLEKLLRIVNFGGGTRFSQMSESVTHVIVSDNYNRNTLKLTHEPKIVHVKWLIDSCKKGKLLPETVYLQCSIPSVIDSFSPISQKHKKITENKENISLPKANPIDDETIIDGMDEVLSQYKISDDGSIQKVSLKSNVSAGDHSTLQSADENTTSADPDEHLSLNVFDNLKFLISSLIKSEEHELLIEGIETRGGIVVSSVGDHDYVVVPLDGDDSLSSDKPMVTFYWIEHCATQNIIVDLKENILFKPVPKNLIQLQPLKGCVVTLSLYSGTERASLIEFAHILGAVCQEFFLRVPKEDALANTHLVIPESQGSKYSAAKRWDIPAVTKDWLLDTAQLCKRPEEKYYSVENPVPKPDCYISPLQSVDNSHGSIEGCIHEQSKDTSPQTKAFFTPTLVAFPEPPKSSETPDIQEIHYVAIPNAVKSPDHFTTPVIPQKSRVQSLRKSSIGYSSVKRLSSASDASGNYLDLSAMSAAFDSPTLDRKSVGHHRNSSQIFQDDCQHYMKLAVEKHGKSDQSPEIVSASMLDKRPLSDITIVVSKKLVKTQGELNNLASSLGANYKWFYDESCTHLIHQGKLNDISRDLRRAKYQNKFVVSPVWLEACKKENKHVDESLYPFTYNSKMNLSSQVSSVKLKSSPKQLSPKDKTNDQPNDRTNDQPKNPISPSTPNISKVSRTESDGLYKQLDDLMSAAKSDSATGRTRHRRLDSAHRNISDDFRRSVPGIDKKLKIKTTSTEDIGPESVQTESQGVGPITWDDPTSRKEREMIAEILAEQGTQETEAVQTNNDISDYSETENEIDIIAGREPEVKDESEPDITEPLQSHMKYFILSGFSEEEKVKYCEIISQLEGTFIDTENFDRKATHLIANKPSKSEKFLASIAAGLWILCPTYLEQSIKEGKFLDEEKYEWGCESIISNMHLPVQLKKIALSTTRWRKTLSENKAKTGAFDGWKVILIVEGEKRCRLERLLDSGGAELVDMRPPFSDSVDATHAFVDASKKNPNTIDLTNLMENNVLCLLMNFIPSYLLENEMTNSDDFSVEGLMKVDISDKKRKPEVGGKFSGSKRVRQR
ncbi:DNA topoisomerase 2-binding protein 1-A [Nymphon striatum]|nr:DNA topoisomerase 2-binding protein 1-A [Nymphon striatum]